jgi:predicted ATPase/DNA-binding XRE family transcriptional regulator
MSSQSHLGDLLRELRRSSGLSQEELAEKVVDGISVDTISNIERGRVRPRRHTLLSLLDALQAGPQRRQIALDAWRLSAEATHGDAHPSSPPAPATPLIGREQELASLQDLLRSEHVRIVTLTGPGGVGKTRLALEAAHTIGAEFADGCTFIDLTPLSDPSQLLPAIAFGLGLADFGDRPMQERLIAHLRPRHMLLLLDNSETAANGSGRLPPVLEACPFVKLLATSREPLRLRAEHEFPVPPLALPEAGTLLALSDLARVPSVDLLLQRARMVAPSFVLTEANASAIAQICARLDGLPLALELAAPRLKHLSPDALVQRLDHALDVLVGGPRDLPERQRTLRAAIDWSHAQLTELEQRLFRRLAVFVDGFTPPAAASVFDGSDAGPGFQVVLDGLLDKNLLTVLHPMDSAEPRFGLLATIHEYASERLEESDEEARIRDRHAKYFCELAESAYPALYSPGRRPWIDALRLDYGNLQAALAWSFDANGERDVGLRLVGALGRFWYFIGQLNDGRAWLKKALQSTEQNDPPALARALQASAKLAWVQGDYARAVADAKEGAAVASHTSDPLLRSDCLALLGYCQVSGGDPQSALAAFEEALELGRGVGAQWQVGFALAMGSEALRLLGDLDRCRTWLDESLAIFRAIGDPWGQGISFAMTAGLMRDLGDLTAVEECMDRAQAAFQAVGEEKYSAVRLRLMRGYVNLQLGRLAHASAHFLEALGIAQELGQTAYILVALAGAGSVAVRRGSIQEAALLYASAASLLAPDAIHVDDGAAAARTAYSTCLPLVRGGLGKAFDQTWQQGLHLDLEAAVSLATTVLSAPQAAGVQERPNAPGLRRSAAPPPAAFFVPGS